MLIRVVFISCAFVAEEFVISVAWCVTVIALHRLYVAVGVASQVLICSYVVVISVDVVRLVIFDSARRLECCGMIRVVDIVCVEKLWDVFGPLGVVQFLSQLSQFDAGWLTCRQLVENLRASSLVKFVLQIYAKLTLELRIVVQLSGL